MNINYRFCSRRGRNFGSAIKSSQVTEETEMMKFRKIYETKTEIYGVF